MRPRSDSPNADIFTAMRLGINWKSGRESEAIRRSVNFGWIHATLISFVYIEAQSICIRHCHVRLIVVAISTKSENIVVSGLLVTILSAK